MERIKIGDYENRAAVFKALAHPARLLVVDELSRGERCVCELTDIIGADISTVSRHLSVLKAAGVIEDDKRGQKVFYSLKMHCVSGFFACVENALRERAESMLAG